MKFQNITTYDRETYLALHRAVFRLSDSRQPLFQRIIRVALPLLLLCSAVYFSRTRGADPMLITGGILGALTLVWGLFSRPLRSLAARLAAPKGAPTCQLDFGPDGYRVTFTAPDGEQAVSDTLGYDTIREACRTGDGFVLMLTRQQGYFLRREGFTVGNAEEFALQLPRWTGKPLTELD